MRLNLQGGHLGDLLLALPAIRDGDSVACRHRISSLSVTWEQGGGFNPGVMPGRHMTDAWCEITRREPIKHLVAERIEEGLTVVAPCVADESRQWAGWGELVKRIGRVVVLDAKVSRQVWIDVLRRARTVVCPDTGTVHMADALYVPVVVGLYGKHFDTHAPFWDRSRCVVRDSMGSIQVEDVLEVING